MRTGLILLCCAQAAWICTCTCLCGHIEGLLGNVEVTPAEIAEVLLKKGSTESTDVVLGRLVEFLELKTLQKAKAAELKELSKSDDDTYVDVEGFVKFIEQNKIMNAKAAEAEQLLKSDHTGDNVEVLVKLFKQKKIEDAMAAEAKCSEAILALVKSHLSSSSG